MNEEIVITTCPKCNGNGFILHDEGSLTCPDCHGEGVWLNNPSQTERISFDIPDYITLNSPKRRQISTLGNWGIVSVGVILFILGLFLWSQGNLTPMVGIGGLLIIVGGIGEAIQLEKRSLSQFDISTHKANISLEKYANWDINRYLYYCLKDKPGLSQIDLISFTICLINHDSRLRNIIWRLEVDPNDVIKILKDNLTPDNLINSKTTSHFATVQPPVRKAIYRGFIEAAQDKADYYQSEYFLIGILKDYPVYADIFEHMNVSLDNIQAVSQWYLADERRARKQMVLDKETKYRPKTYMNRAWTALPTPFIDHYSKDLTYLASVGALNYTNTRQDILDQIIQLLDQHDKAALLIAPPGTNYEVIINSLAYQIASNTLTGQLADTRLISLSMSAFMDPRGSIEENLNLLLHEASQAGNVVIYIDDFHNLVGTSNQSFDAASLFSNMLSDYGIRVICATTSTNYRRLIKSNQKLTGLLSNIDIKPLSIEDSLNYLEENVPRYESLEHVVITYPAIVEAVKGADHFIKKLPLPESALTLLEQSIDLVKSNKGGWVSQYSVKEAIEHLTNIKVNDPDQNESNQLLDLENILHKKVVGQDLAIDTISAAIRRNRAGLQNTNRPISFLFVGPTGVGKTETAKALASTVFQSEKNMIRLDMSEYSKASDIDKIIGQPNQDAHRRNFGSLTEAIIENPYSLILLDEFEKADNSIKNLFLQLLDEGRLTDGNDETVDFTHTIIIATSNAGSDQIRLMIEQGKGDEIQGQISGILQAHFKPELLNRFDGIIPFTPLSPKELEQIAVLMLNDVITKAQDRDYEISFSNDVIAYIAKAGYDPVFGARAMRRVIQDKIEDYLAKQIIAERILPGKGIQITRSMLQ